MLLTFKPENKIKTIRKASLGSASFINDNHITIAIGL
jgi:hypothetical protein